MRTIFSLLALGAGVSALGWAHAVVSGRITDPQGKAVVGAAVKLVLPNNSPVAQIRTDDVGRYSLRNVTIGEYRLIVSAPGFTSIAKEISLSTDQAVDLQFVKLEAQSQSVVITARSIESTIDLRNAEVFNRTLFTRDDQILQQLNAGINAGQHEGGGKSLEIRRFGFNLDHGGVNGGLKVLIDDVQQNQGSQGHGQGYLGSLKALSPELIQEVTIINGPFSPEYGDFSGLGVVHIRRRESLPDEFTARLEGGNFDAGRGFLAYSPAARRSIPILRTKVPTAMDLLSILADIAVIMRMRITLSRSTTPRSWDFVSSSDETISTLPGRFRWIWLHPANSIGSALRTLRMAGALS
jgi:hypothetical protein